MAKLALMTTPEHIIEVARTFMKTPFLHQGAHKNLGVDCVHFIEEVARESGAFAHEVEFSNDYNRQEDGKTLLKLLRENLDIVDSLDDARQADIIAFHNGATKNKPKHIGFIDTIEILNGERVYSVIHAGESGVVRQRMDESINNGVGLEVVHSIWRVRDLISD